MDDEPATTVREDHDATPQSDELSPNTERQAASSEPLSGDDVTASLEPDNGKSSNGEADAAIRNTENENNTESISDEEEKLSDPSKETADAVSAAIAKDKDSSTTTSIGDDSQEDSSSLGQVPSKAAAPISGVPEHNVEIDMESNNDANPVVDHTATGSIDSHHLDPSPSDDFIADPGESEENTSVATQSVERALSVTYAEDVVKHSVGDGVSTRPHTRDSSNSRGSKHRKTTTKALDFTWILGFDCQLAGGVHYLADNEREEIFVPAGHLGMLFAHIDHEQALLQGHCHGIVATAASVDKRWMATADNGPSCTTIVWDTVAGEAERSWFGDALDNVGHLAFSADATLFAALDGPHLDRLTLWDWSAADVDTPLVSVTLPPPTTDLDHTHTSARPSSLAFHPDDPTLLVVTRGMEVYTVRWTPAGSAQTETMHVKGVSHRKLGTFTHSLFLPRSSIAVTTTSGGFVVLWETGSAGTQTRCLKYIEVFDAPITYATMTPDGETFVAGGHDGAVKYFDTQFRLVGWNDQLDCGPITSISFTNAETDTADGFGRRASLASLGLGAKEVDVPNYLVATTHGRVLLVSTDPDVRAAQELMSFQAADVRAIAPHPHTSVLAVAGFGGRLQLWNYSLKTDVVQVELGADKHVTAMCFSPDGEAIALGYSNGKVSILDAMSLTELSRKSSFRDLDDTVTHLRFAPDGAHFAVATANNFVGLFRLLDDPKESGQRTAHPSTRELDDEERWMFVGKYQSHAARVTDIRFGTDRDGNVRLLSIGADRMLVEYDLVNSSFGAGLLLKGVRVHMEQTAFPTTLDWYPRSEEHLEDFLLTTTSDFKLKLFNATTKQCRCTTIGPVADNPVSHLSVVPPYPHKDSARIVAFACGANVGLQLLPVDGNPHKIVMMIGHAASVTALVHSHDGRYLFSAAGNNVHMMTVNTHVLSAQAALGGSGAEPFVRMLEGGRDGPLYKDLEDYFYYIQLDNQGLDHMETRTVSDRIPLSQVPRVFRAVGYYPSEQEIVNITNEVKFSKFLETRQHVNDVDIDTLVRLLVNHRPAVPLSADGITDAFKALGDTTTGEVGTSDLLDLLAKRGEFMHDDELAKILGTLLGGRNVVDVLSTTTAPEKFTSGVLGF
eukprot:m.765015 g.765015  ORF g.765015 m.765015 type:complete len:1127 (-) comp23219_c0_seq1:190-3570(-)